MAAERAFRTSVVVGVPVGVIEYGFPFRATVKTPESCVDVTLTAALLKELRVISFCSLMTSCVAGLVSEAIRVPDGMTVPSIPVQRTW